MEQQPEDPLAVQCARIQRLAPHLWWPEAAYTPDIAPYGTFMRTFFDTKTNKAVRQEVADTNGTGSAAVEQPPEAIAQPTDGAEAAKQAEKPRGFNLSFKRKAKAKAADADAAAAQDSAKEATQAVVDGQAAGASTARGTSSPGIILSPPSESQPAANGAEHDRSQADAVEERGSPPASVQVVSSPSSDSPGPPSSTQSGQVEEDIQQLPDSPTQPANSSNPPGAEAQQAGQPGQALEQGTGEPASEPDQPLVMINAFQIVEADAQEPQQPVVQQEATAEQEAAQGTAAQCATSPAHSAGAVKPPAAAPASSQPPSKGSVQGEPSPGDNSAMPPVAAAALQEQGRQECGSGPAAQPDVFALPEPRPPSGAGSHRAAPSTKSHASMQPQPSLEPGELAATNSKGAGRVASSGKADSVKPAVDDDATVPAAPVTDKSGAGNGMAASKDDRSRSKHVDRLHDSRYYSSSRHRGRSRSRSRIRGHSRERSRDRRDTRGRRAHSRSRSGGRRHSRSVSSSSRSYREGRRSRSRDGGRHRQRSRDRRGRSWDRGSTRDRSRDYSRGRSRSPDDRDGRGKRGSRRPHSRDKHRSHRDDHRSHGRKRQRGRSSDSSRSSSEERGRHQSSKQRRAGSPTSRRSSSSVSSAQLHDRPSDAPSKRPSGSISNLAALDKAGRASGKTQPASSTQAAPEVPGKPVAVAESAGGARGAAADVSQQSGSDMEIEGLDDEVDHSRHGPVTDSRAGHTEVRQDSRLGDVTRAGSSRDAGRADHSRSSKGGARDAGKGDARGSDRVKRGLAPLFVCNLPDADIDRHEREGWHEQPTDFAAVRRTMEAKQSARRGGDVRTPAGGVAPRQSRPGDARGAVQAGVRGSTRGSDNTNPDLSCSQVSSGQRPSSPKTKALKAGAGRAAPGSDTKQRPGKPGGSSQVAGRSSRPGEGGPHPGTPKKPAAREQVETEPMGYEFEGGGWEEVLGELSCKRAGPNESLPAPDSKLDDLPYLAFNMMKFSSSLLLGSAADPDLPPLLVMPGATFTTQASARIGRHYKRDLLTKLQETAREVKSKGDSMIRNARSWSTQAVLLYIQASLTFMEMAYGNEQSLTDRDRGIADALSVLDTLVAHSPSPGMLRLVEQQSTILLKMRKSALRGLSQSDPRYQHAQAEVLTLQAICLLAQQLLAVALTKIIILRKDSLASAADTLAPASGPEPALRVPGAGSSATVLSGQAGGNAKGASGARGTQVGVSPPPADSASSTLEAVNSVSLTTWSTSLHTLSTCMRQFASVGEMWRSAAAGVRELYKETSELAAKSAVQGPGESSKAADAANNSMAGEAAPNAGWTRLAHTASAQLLSLGYEWGMWDLLGTITVARQVLDTVLQLPGVGTG